VRIRAVRTLPQPRNLTLRTTAARSEAAMTAATHVRKARHDSECPLCCKWIRPGQQIAKVHGIWICIRCALDHTHQQDGQR
jgi:hypothetical protein